MSLRCFVKYFQSSIINNRLVVWVLSGLFFFFLNCLSGGMGLGKALNHFTRNSGTWYGTLLRRLCDLPGTENADVNGKSVSEGATLSLPPDWKLSNCCPKGTIS